jgi:hypothetical protein
MTRRRWTFGVVAVAGVVALVVPAVGQGKAASASLGWSRSRAGATITSYAFGAVDGGASVSRGFRLGNSGLTESGKLVLRLAGSSRFSITSDRCTGKSLGSTQSCWVGVAYRPLGAPKSNSVTLTASGVRGAVASLRLSGRNTGPTGHVYWGSVTAAGGTVSVVSRGGGRATTLASGQDLSQHLSVAVDSAHVYWVSGYAATAVKEVPLGGGSVTTLASTQNGAVSLAVDGTHVYWVEPGDEQVPTGTVKEVRLGGGNVTTLAKDQDYPVSVAVDGTHVYWTNWGNGKVNEVPLGGGKITTLATGQYAAVSVAVDGTHVYWVNRYGGTVNEVPLGGGSVTTLASGQSEPVSVAVDGTHVYWVDYGSCDECSDGTVNEVPLGGGSVTTLASGQGEPVSLAVDGTHVYWTNYGDGTVNKVRLGDGPVTALATGQGQPWSVAIGP